MPRAAKPWIVRIKGKSRPRPSSPFPQEGGVSGYAFEESEEGVYGDYTVGPRPLPPGLVCCLLIFLVSLFVSGLWVYEHFIDNPGGVEEGVSKTILFEKDTIFAPSTSVSPSTAAAAAAATAATAAAAALPPTSSTLPSSSPTVSEPSVSPSPPAPPPDGVKWGVVVQGLLYPQGIGSWGSTTLSAVWPPTTPPSPPLTVMCTWDTEHQDPLFARYMGEGFLPCNATMEDFQALGGVVPGAQNVNFQKYTAYKGLLAAQARGVTHAIKVRGDVRITNPWVFIQEVLGPLTTLSFLITWVGTTRYPVDYLVAGPIGDVLEYFAPPFQDPQDGRFPELFLMEEFSKKRGWSAEDGPNHIAFCRGVDFFFPRLPMGIFFFDHKGNNDNRDMAGPIVPYRTSLGDICLLEPGQS